MIVVHHSASSRETTKLTDIDRWHKEKGFPLSKLGYHVGYHYVIGRDWIKQTRLIEEIGAHALNWNEESIGICLTGHFETEYPNKYQLQELGKLLVGLMAQYGLKEVDIKLHKDLNQTACPGKNLPRELVLDSLKYGQVPNTPPVNEAPVQEAPSELQIFLKELQALISKYRQ